MTEQVSSGKIHRAWGTVLLRLQRLSDPEWVELLPQVFTRVLGFGTVLRRQRAATLWNSRPCSICLRKMACTVGRCDISNQIRRLWLRWRVEFAFGGFFCANFRLFWRENWRIFVKHLNQRLLHDEVYRSS